MVLYILVNFIQKKPLLVLFNPLEFWRCFTEQGCPADTMGETLRAIRGLRGVI